MTRILRTSLALATLVVVIALLHFAARFNLRGPTGFGSAELSTWMNDPVTAIATIVRWIALLLTYYLTAVVLGVAVFADGLEKSPLGQLVPTGLVASIGLLLGIGAVGLLSQPIWRPAMSKLLPNGRLHLRCTRSTARFRCNPFLSAFLTATVIR